VQQATSGDVNKASEDKAKVVASVEDFPKVEEGGKSQAS